MDREKLLELFSEELQTEKNPVYRVVASFIVRDFKVWWTYKFWLTLEMAGLILLVGTYYLFSFITSSQQVQEAGYLSGGYFTFALIGLAFQQYVSFAVQSLNMSVREEQYDGTMEILLSSATDIRTFLLGETCFYFIISSTYLIVSFSVGIMLGASFNVTLASIASALILSVLLIVSHMAIGVLSAGVIMKTKQGNPFLWAFSWVSQLVSGVFYPLKLLPWYLEWIGKLFPLTYSIDGIRLCLQSGQDFSTPAVLSNAVSLLIFTAVATPLALYFFEKGYNSARRAGSLGHY